MYWDDLIANYTGRNPGKMVWSCNCKAPIRKGSEQIFTKLYPTEVDHEGICTLCGHYAYRVSAKTLDMVWQRGKYFRDLNYKK